MIRARCETEIMGCYNPQRLLDLVPGVIMGQMFMPISFLRKIYLFYTHQCGIQNCHGKPIHIECYPIVFKIKGKSPVI